MDSGKGEHAAGGDIKCRIRSADFAGGDIGPADKPHVVIEQQVPAGLAAAYQKRGYGAWPDLRLEPPDIQVGKDIYIMDKES